MNMNISTEPLSIASFVCPISHEIMIDPVVTPNGDTFERSYIEKWIQDKGTCPITRNKIGLKDLVPNTALKLCIISKKTSCDIIINDKKIEKPCNSATVPPHTISPVVNPITQVQNSISTWTRGIITYQSPFVNIGTLSIVRSNPHSRVVPVDIDPAPETIDPVQVTAPVLPQEYLFPTIISHSDRATLICGYKTMNRVPNAWKDMRNFSVDPTGGFQFGFKNDKIDYILNEISRDYPHHSGCSMGCTARILQFISRYGITAFESRP